MLKNIAEVSVELDERGDFMKVNYSNIKENEKIVIWGTGRTMKKFFDRLDPGLKIVGFCDTYSTNWGKRLKGELLCVSPNDISAENVVIIAIKEQKDIDKVAAELDKNGICYCHILEAVAAYQDEWEKKEIEKFESKYQISDFENKIIPQKLVKFINCHIPFKTCNLKCNYCYVRQTRDFYINKLQLHSPEFIAKALSPIRLGGVALINFCAGGETMMVKELIPIVAALVEEGHYIQIVTNGTIDSAFDKLLESSTDFKHIFVKFSFHYKELVRTGKLNNFFDNVKKMRKAGCSISVELVASDDLVPLIEEIKESCMTNLGALPHLTIPRDDTVKELKLLSKLEKKEYYDIWKQFDSTMFEFKWENLNLPRFEHCMAGKWSFAMNLESGDIDKCLNNPYLDNVYDDITSELHFEEVGNKCALPYCYNCHAYLTFGLIKEVQAPTYYEVRNRTTKEGRQWITDELKLIFEQKLYINNQ